MRRPHLDTNHREIARELTGRGVEVVEVFQPLDLLCFWRGFIGWIEVKLPNSRAVYTRPQIKFIANTRMPVTIAQTAQDAWNFLTSGEGLSQRQKDSLAAFLVQDDRKQWHREIIERALNV